MKADLLRDTTPVWEDLTFDSFLFYAAADYVKREKPRLVFVDGEWQVEPFLACGPIVRYFRQLVSHGRSKASNLLGGHVPVATGFT